MPSKKHAFFKICLKCITDESLRELASEEAGPGICNYCQNNGPGLPMNKLADIVDDFLRKYCCLGEEIPHFDSNSDNPTYEQEGEPLLSLLQEELGIDVDPAEDLAEILIKKDPANYRHDEDAYYSDDQNYRRVYFEAGKYTQLWNSFTNRIKHKRRFFDDNTKKQLANILGEPGSQKAISLPVIEIGPNSKINNIYRARRANNAEEVDAIRSRADKELAPPPPIKASAGRMNPTGISVFYGALSENTAIAEARPSVGSLVVLGQFRSVRTLRLLDLTQIGKTMTGSIFQTGYENRAARSRFMEHFHALISKPIQPSDELLEYLPTQVISEYVHSILGFDGILYASAQVGATPEVPEPSQYIYVKKLTKEELGQCNIVLFGPTARVQRLPDAINNTLEEVGPKASNDGLIINPKSIHAFKVNAIKYRYQLAQQ